eukprot:scaffold133719_cov20-Tisochrysis_lutea.AAC.1
MRVATSHMRGIPHRSASPQAAGGEGAAERRGAARGGGRWEPALFAVRAAGGGGCALEVRRAGAEARECGQAPRVRALAAGGGGDA